MTPFATRYLSVLLAGTALFAAPLAAQETAAAPAVADSSDMIDANEIVVTAQRREQKLQDVPVSVIAFSELALQEAGIRNTADVMAMASSSEGLANAWVEALASGTPVIAFRSGALPEIVEHGVTGLIVDDVRGMADAIARIGDIDPAACRRAALERFPVRRTTDAYLALYGRLIE